MIGVLSFSCDSGMKDVVYKVLVVLVAGCFAFSARAQETKIYSIANPKGEAMSLRSMWVADSANFTVEPLSQLPSQIPGNGTVDFRVRILPKDGIMRTTEVFYRTENGISSYTISLTPPVIAGTLIEAQPPHDKPAYPNPAKEFTTLDVDIRLYPNVQVDVINDIGVRVIGITPPVAGKLVLDTRKLANGTYHVAVYSNGTIVRKEEVVVRH